MLSFLSCAYYVFDKSVKEFFPCKLPWKRHKKEEQFKNCSSLKRQKKVTESCILELIYIYIYIERERERESFHFLILLYISVARSII